MLYQKERTANKIDEETYLFVWNTKQTLTQQQLLKLVSDQAELLN